MAGISKYLQLSAPSPHISASFSPSGAQLLTTDQKNEIRVYSASQWDCPPLLIPHPHRQFQHLTPIKVRETEQGAGGWWGLPRQEGKQAETETENPYLAPTQQFVVTFYFGFWITSSGPALHGFIPKGFALSVTSAAPF